MADVKSFGKPELLSALFVVALATLGGGLFVRHYEWGTNPPAQVFPGMQLSGLAGHSWSSGRRTLVLALRLHCSHCENNQKFYQRLVRLELSGRIAAHILAVFPDPATEVEHAMAAGAVAQQTLADIDLRKLGVTGTPTLILVDNNGQVQNVWVGELAAAEQDAVVRAVQ